MCCNSAVFMRTETHVVTIISSNVRTVFNLLQMLYRIKKTEVNKCYQLSMI